MAITLGKPRMSPQEFSSLWKSTQCYKPLCTLSPGPLGGCGQASAELRRIVAGLVQRVPELEPSRVPQEASRAHSEGSAGEDTLTTPGGPEESVSRRSWWRRMFGV